jgi:hypothetical protein
MAIFSMVRDRLEMRRCQSDMTEYQWGREEMWARTTRVEFVIVTAGLLVLLFCSQPPQSGNAEVGYLPADAESPSWSPEGPASAADENDLPEPLKRPQDAVEPGDSGAAAPTAQNLPNQQQAPRGGAVDARGVRQSSYNNVMYGDVTVRWVWNGSKFVPQRVCVVKEKDGVSSVWSFDQPGDAVVSEIPQNTGTSP